MATRLYMLNELNALSGTFPVGEQSAYAPDVVSNEAGLIKRLGTAKGNSATYSYAGVGYSDQRVFFNLFCSAPLDGAQTVGGGALTINGADAQGAIRTMRFNGVHAYVWRPSTGTKVGTIKDTVSSLGGTPASAINSLQVTHITGITSSAVAAQDGDVIIVEVWTGLLTAGDVTFVYFGHGGNTENVTENAVVTKHASFIEFTENLTFKTKNGQGQAAGATTQSGVSRASKTARASAAGTGLPRAISRNIANAGSSAAGGSAALSIGSILERSAMYSVSAVTADATGLGASAMVGAAPGTSSASAEGSTPSSGVGQALGSTGSDGRGSVLKRSSGYSTNRGTALATGTAYAGQASSAGVAVVEALGFSITDAYASASGEAVPAGVGGATVDFVGASVGLGNDSVIGEALSAAVMESTCLGFAGGLAIGAHPALAESLGVAEVLAIGSGSFDGVGASEGLSAVLSEGEALGIASGTGLIEGAAGGDMVGASLGSAVAYSECMATIAGVMRQIGWSRPASAWASWVEEAREI